MVTSKPACIGLGVDADGDKHVLGIWIAKTPLEDATAGESARFWGGVAADLRNRGVRDIVIACCDGPAGFEDAIHSAFPAATVQTCVVHLIRNALRPVALKDWDQVAKELRKIYSAPNADAAFEVKTYRSTRHTGLDELITSLNRSLAGWANYFRYGVSKATFSAVDNFAWGRLMRWIRAKHAGRHRLGMTELRHRFCDQGWRFACNGVTFTGASSVTVKRYRYRGSQIPTPWTPQPAAANNT